ncbi:hypothetical protein IJ135_01490 [Candidatus Saccharibacteria bacterium]|nr:hypothetical protein [Candidatus Saccharibacteria bacterium]
MENGAVMNNVDGIGNEPSAIEGVAAVNDYDAPHDAKWYERRRRGKILKVVLAVAAVLSLTFMLIRAIINVNRPATVEILMAPSFATAEIRGAEYRSGTYELDPGEAEAVITADGFTTKTMRLGLVGGETTKLYVYLMPEDGSLDWYLAHPEEQMILNTIGDARANAESAAYAEENPIVEVLPIIYANYDAKWEYTEFRVDGGKFEECEKEFCLKITDATGGNYENALELIRKKGFNPEDYEIIYEYAPVEEL